MVAKVFDPEQLMHDIVRMYLRDENNESPFDLCVVSTRYYEHSYKSEGFKGLPGIPFAINKAKEGNIVIVFDGFCISSEEKEELIEYVRLEGGTGIEVVFLPVSRSTFLDTYRSILKRLS